MNRPLLVLTPTLGDSPFLDRTVASVAALGLRLRHILIAPAHRRGELSRRYPAADVAADRGAAEGLYGALNAGLASAGEDWEWFTYINDDDALLPALAEVARRHDARPRPEPVAYGDVALIDARGRELSLVTTERHPHRIPALLQQGISPLTQQGMLFRRELVRRLGGFDRRYRLCADLDFWVRAYAAGAAFRYYPRTLAQFRLREGQLSGDTALTRRELGDIVTRHLGGRSRPLARAIARAGYRLQNLPRYLARWRARGWRTSYELLEGS